MKFADMQYRFSEFWSEFKKERSGLVGLAILVLSLLVVIFEPVILPWKEANSKWRNIDYWQDNSASAPPAWTNAFTKLKAPVTVRLDEGKKEEAYLDGGVQLVTYTFEYDYGADKAPLDVIFHVTGHGDIPVQVSVERPDGVMLDFAQRFEQGLAGQDIRISLDNDGREAAFSFIKTTRAKARSSDIRGGAFEQATYSSTSLARAWPRNSSPSRGRINSW